MVTVPVEKLIASAITMVNPAATEVAVMDARQFVGDLARPDTLIRARWTSEDVTQIGQFLIKTRSSTEAAEEAALSDALVSSGIPVPRVLLVEPSAAGSFVVEEYVSGHAIAQSLIAALMRWELSALGFTYGRMLARIHALEWAKVVPWMGDAEAAPESIVDDELDDSWASWEEQISRIPDEYQPICNEALAWLDERRPVEVSLCLCHGDFRPAHVLMADDDVLAVTGWGNARVTDASYDLALMPFDIRQLKLPDDDSDLLHQAIIGSYLQASNRSLGNLRFYAVARLLSAGLQSLDQGDRATESIAAFSSDADELFAAMHDVMVPGRKPLWRA
ncbi:MAG TPA: phosphotransferase [Nitrolancea sp.]|nr:phosphotransferase [Nitrolancea sp.]